MTLPPLRSAFLQGRPSARAPPAPPFTAGSEPRPRPWPARTPSCPLAARPRSQPRGTALPAHLQPTPPVLPARWLSGPSGAWLSHCLAIPLYLLSLNRAVSVPALCRRSLCVSISLSLILTLHLSLHLSTVRPCLTAPQAPSLRPNSTNLYLFRNSTSTLQLSLPQFSRRQENATRSAARQQPLPPSWTPNLSPPARGVHSLKGEDATLRDTAHLFQV